MISEPTFNNWREELDFLIRRMEENRQWIHTERLSRAGFNLRWIVLEQVEFHERIDGILDRLVALR